MIHVVVVRIMAEHSQNTGLNIKNSKTSITF